MNTLAIGSDHAGFHYKEAIIRHLRAQGYAVIDFGTDSDQPVDYPDVIRPTAQSVANGEHDGGIVLGGSGNVILSACVQALLNVVEFGMSAVEAVYAPRIHAEGSTIWHEARIRQAVSDGLAAHRHSVKRDPASLSPRMARVQMALIGPDGELTGGSDPRAGSAMMVTTNL